MEFHALDKSEIIKRVDSALEENINFRKTSVFGLPATFLDEVEFYEDAQFLNEAPFLKTLVANPNHIGCHTLGDSESYFSGTQKLEKKLISILAENIFKAQENKYDGYVCAGGTEANIQAFWIYRNYFKSEYKLKNDEILIMASEDSHYSIDKGGDLLSIPVRKIPVNENTRKMDSNTLIGILNSYKNRGIKAVIFQINMGTTMFGSVDDIDKVVKILKQVEVPYKIHVDGAFGGFIYPFSYPEQKINFSHPDVSSISLDAHKMLQAPYGTGVFLVRKGFMSYTQTQSAKYVKGYDYTLSGSRSGANAVAVWMILMRYGKAGWKAKIDKLIALTDYTEKELKKLGIPFFREPRMNIITFRNEALPENLRLEYKLVSDGSFSKIVIMTHVIEEKINDFINGIKDGIISKTV